MVKTRNPELDKLPGPAKGVWNHSLAVSALHKSLRMGLIETAAYCAAWLCRYKRGKDAAWRRVLAFPSEDMGGEGVERVIALYRCWEAGHEDDNLFDAIIYLCRLVTGEPTPERKKGLNREADELKCAAIWWIQSGKVVDPPKEAYDMHVGAGTLASWWANVNKLGPASPWREDAVQLVDFGHEKNYGLAKPGHQATLL